MLILNDAGPCGAPVARRRGLTGLVERDPQLETLRRCRDRAQAGGINVAHVVGEADIGKSRLMHEFRQRLPDEGAFVLEGDCHADGATSAFLPFVEVVRTAFRISAEGARAAVERKLKGGIEALGLAAANA